MTQADSTSEGALGARIRALLDDRGVSWPPPILHFDVLRSTSDHLKRLAQDGAPEWTVVLAERQTAGRGRQGHTWLSPAGSLYLSVLLHPHLGPDVLGLIPLAAGVAVAESIGERGAEARLKWPNDVLIRGRKVAGILAEGSSGSRGPESVVLGIGVNITPVEGSREGVAATSLATEGALVDRAVLAASVLARLRVCYHALDQPRRVLEQWRALSVPWWGRGVEVTSGAARLRGIARGVDDRGALLLEMPDGATKAVVSGEARELRLNP